jgi:prophage antirepressor-like protein
MTTDLILFKGFNIRMARGEIGQPLVCLADICKAVGITNSGNVSGRITTGIHNLDTPTAGGVQKMVFVSEAGMYEVLLGSRKPIAKELASVLVTKMAEMRQQTTVPALATSALKEATRILSAVVDKIDEHDARIAELEKDRQIVAVISAPVKEISTRLKINQVVRTYAQHHDKDYRECFKTLYYEFKYRYGIDLVGRTHNNGNKTVLDTAEQLGCLDDLFTLAVALFVGK